MVRSICTITLHLNERVGIESCSVCRSFSFSLFVYRYTFPFPFPTPRYVQTIQGLEALLHSGRDGSKVSIYFARRTTENQADNRFASHVNVLEAAQNVHSLPLQAYPCLGSVFDGKLSFAILARYTADRPPQMLTTEHLHVLDLECLNVKVV